MHDLQELVCKSVAHLDAVPEVHQLLANGNKGLGVAREKDIFLTLGIEDAPYLAVILQFLHVTDSDLLPCSQTRQ